MSSLDPTEPTEPTHAGRREARELVWASTETHVGRLLMLRRGESTGRHYHRDSAETLYLLSGAALLTIRAKNGPQVIIMSPWGTYDIPAGTVHSVVGLDDAEIVEISHAEPTDRIAAD